MILHTRPRPTRYKRRTILGGLAATGVFPIAVSAIEPPPSPPVFHGQARQYTELRPPMSAPIAPFFDAEEQPYDISAWRGKIVLLSFWATWCVPCVWEMPILDRLEGKMGGDNFAVVPIALDEDGLAAVPRAKAFYARVGITQLPLLFDPSGLVFEAYRSVNRVGMPMSYVLDRASRLRGYLIGPA